MIQEPNFFFDFFLSKILKNSSFKSRRDVVQGLKIVIFRLIFGLMCQNEAA